MFEVQEALEAQKQDFNRKVGPVEIIQFTFPVMAR